MMKAKLRIETERCHKAAHSCQGHLNRLAAPQAAVFTTSQTVESSVIF